MIRLGIAGLALALLWGCTFERQVSAPPPSIAVDQVDGAITYALDPQLDHLVLEFDCGGIHTMKLDYGDTVGRMVRTTIAQRYAQATEVAAGQADVTVLLQGASYSAQMQQQTWTLHAVVAFEISLRVTGPDGQAIRAFGSDTETEDLTYPCDDMLDLFDRMSPDVLRQLATRVAQALPVP